LSIKLSFSSTAIAGEVVGEIAEQSWRSEGVQHVSAAQENLLTNTKTISSFTGADAPDPLRAVAHLPRSSVSFGNARVEKIAWRVLS